MEYADGGDLYSKVKAHIKAHTHFAEQEIWKLFGEMCTGLDALHKLNICHRDLKCANMFLTKGQIKIGDLNVSKVVKRNLLFTRVGTPYYASPEIWNDKPYDQKSDMWSLGCVLYEMCALRPPFTAGNLRELSKKIVLGVYPQIPSIYSAEMTQVLRGLLQLNPNTRLSCCTFYLLIHLAKVLNMLSATNRVQGMSKVEPPNELMTTIVLPTNLNSLNSRLPKPNYKYFNILT
jgi:NIMA (never in mitosis gene a)-related kinase